MWDPQEQKKIIQTIKKEKDLYKFLELISLIHEGIAEDLKKQKILNLREDLDFIRQIIKFARPKKEDSKEHSTFDTNILYTLEGLELGLDEYLNRKPKEEVVEKTTEEEIKKMLEESYKYCLDAKKESDLAFCKETFSKAAALILSGVAVSEFLATHVPYKKDNRVMLWTESIMQIVEHSKDYPITPPSDFQETIDAIWKNLKNYEIDQDLISSPNVKENYKKINVLVKNFVKEFLNNKTEVEKAISVLRPLYIEYIDKLDNPKIKKQAAISTAKRVAGKSDLIDCEIVNIDSDVVNPLIEEYNTRFSKKVDLIEDDYITVWKVRLKKRKLLAKKPITVLVDSVSGDVIGSYS